MAGDCRHKKETIIHIIQRGGKNNKKVQEERLAEYADRKSKKPALIATL